MLHCVPRSESELRGGLAGIAQRLEQLTCNQQVSGSIPDAGSNVYNVLYQDERSILILGHQ